MSATPLSANVIARDVSSSCAVEWAHVLAASIGARAFRERVGELISRVRRHHLIKLELIILEVVIVEVVFLDRIWFELGGRASQPARECSSEDILRRSLLREVRLASLQMLREIVCSYLFAASAACLHGLATEHHDPGGFPVPPL
jgi:hypothetical protein